MIELAGDDENQAKANLDKGSRKRNILKAYVQGVSPCTLDRNRLTCSMVDTLSCPYNIVKVAHCIGLAWESDLETRGTVADTCMSVLWVLNLIGFESHRLYGWPLIACIWLRPYRLVAHKVVAGCMENNPRPLFMILAND